MNASNATHIATSTRPNATGAEEYKPKVVDTNQKQEDTAYWIDLINKYGLFTLLGLGATGTLAYVTRDMIRRARVQPLPRPPVENHGHHIAGLSRMFEEGLHHYVRDNPHVFRNGLDEFARHRANGDVRRLRDTGYDIKANAFDKPVLITPSPTNKTSLTKMK